MPYSRWIDLAENHFKSLWPCQAHVLVPLAEPTGKGSFQWTPCHDAAFKEIKISSQQTQWNERFPWLYSIPFQMYTDASDFQLGTAIIQRKKLIAYYSKKLTSTEKKFLAIVTTLKNYCKMLMGSKITSWNRRKQEMNWDGLLSSDFKMFISKCLFHQLILSCSFLW